MAVRISKALTVDNILEQINELDIFSTYCSNFKKVGELFKSELRVDNNPTCKILVYEDGIFYRDFNGPSYNCFGYVKVKYGVDFNTALNIINQDFKLGLRSTWSNNSEEVKRHVQLLYSNEKPIVKSGKFIIKKKKRKWFKIDADYWLQYSIHSSTLELFNVEPIEFFWVNEYRFRCETITYSYEFGNGKRDIYSPLSKDRKWPVSNTTKEHIYGWNQLPETGDLVFITSSNKEVMFLYEMGYVAVAPQAESTFLPEDKLSELRQRFKKIVILFDFDEAGCNWAKKWGEMYDLQYMKFCPTKFKLLGFKDLTDGYVQNSKYIINLLKECNKMLL